MDGSLFIWKHLRRYAFTETHGFAGIAGLPWLDVAVSGDPMFARFVDGKCWDGVGGGAQKLAWSQRWGSVPLQGLL